eukprot:gene12087-8314_t
MFDFISTIEQYAIRKCFDGSVVQKISSPEFADTQVKDTRSI